MESVPIWAQPATTMTLSSLRRMDGRDHQTAQIGGLIEKVARKIIRLSLLFIRALSNPVVYKNARLPCSRI
jgi:hypothetical protein